MRTHKHHIVPRHMGGTDDPSNLIILTVEQHAEAHKVLYDTHGLWQDFIAWKTLSGQMTQSEASILASQQGASKGGRTTASKYFTSERQSKYARLGALALTFEQRSAAGKIGGAKNKGKPKAYDTTFVTSNPSSIKLSCARCRKVIAGASNLRQHYGGRRCVVLE